jgi:hypothetical protein
MTHIYGNRSIYEGKGGLRYINLFFLGGVVGIMRGKGADKGMLV